MKKDVSSSFEKDHDGRHSQDESGHAPDQRPVEQPEKSHGAKFDFVKARNRFWMALALSVFLHMTLGGGLVLTPATSLKKRPSKTTVELMSPEELKAMLDAQKKNAPITGKQIVETDKTRLNDEVDPNAKYLSQYDQRVVKQTRAALAGKFANDAGQGRTQAASTTPKTPEQNETEAKDPKSSDKTAMTEDQAAAEAELQAFEHGDISVAAKKGLQKFNPSFRKLPVVPDPTAEEQAAGDGNEVSKTDDHLKDVPTGMQTMLSTREFVYYSYYNRIKDKLRQYWEPKIKEKFERTIRQGRQIASEGDKITKVIIILDEKGTLIGVQVLSASGIVDLDEAAVEAFRAAAPFPNPPKGIVEEDGTIKIRWDFVLEA